MTTSAAYTDTLPDTDELERLDFALGIARCRDGRSPAMPARLEQAYTMMGLAYAQTGKDLTRCTADRRDGRFAHPLPDRTEEIAAHALQDPQRSHDTLMPHKGKDPASTAGIFWRQWGF